MNKTISRAYRDFETARGVVSRLERAGFTADEISLIGRPGDTDESLATGAGVGGLVGGGAGLLAGLGLVTVPGLGPFVAVGWLASTLVGGSAGALTGSIVGALAASGAEAEEANRYAQTLKEGGAVVLVRADADRLDLAGQILDEAEPLTYDSLRSATPASH
jgi:hypothetical protein